MLKRDELRPSLLWAEQSHLKMIGCGRAEAGRGATSTASVVAYPHPTGPNKNLGQPPSPQGAYALG
jgi:hypothetical protein